MLQILSAITDRSAMQDCFYTELSWEQKFTMRLKRLYDLRDVVNRKRANEMQVK